MPKTAGSSNSWSRIPANRSHECSIYTTPIDCKDWHIEGQALWDSEIAPRWTTTSSKIQNKVSCIRTGQFWIPTLTKLSSWKSQTRKYAMQKKHSCRKDDFPLHACIRFQKNAFVFMWWPIYVRRWIEAHPCIYSCSSENSAQPNNAMKS